MLGYSVNRLCTTTRGAPLFLSSSAAALQLLPKRSVATRSQSTNSTVQLGSDTLLIKSFSAKDTLPEAAKDVYRQLKKQLKANQISELSEYDHFSLGFYNRTTQENPASILASLPPPLTRNFAACAASGFQEQSNKEEDDKNFLSLVTVLKRKEKKKGKNSLESPELFKTFIATKDSLPESSAFEAAVAKKLPVHFLMFSSPSYTMCSLETLQKRIEQHSPTANVVATEPTTTASNQVPIMAVSDKGWISTGQHAALGVSIAGLDNDQFKRLVYESIGNVKTEGLAANSAMLKDMFQPKTTTPTEQSILNLNFMVGKRKGVARQMEMPILSLSNVVIYPHCRHPLPIRRYQDALIIKQAVERGVPFGIVCRNNSDGINNSHTEKSIGTAAKVLKLKMSRGGASMALLEGISRFQVHEERLMFSSFGGHSAKVTLLEEKLLRPDPSLETIRAECDRLLIKVIGDDELRWKRYELGFAQESDLLAYSFFLAAAVPALTDKKHKWLNATDCMERYQMIRTYLLEVLTLRADRDRSKSDAASLNY